MKQPLDDRALDQLFRTARSHYYFEDRPVTRAQMDAIWEIMKFGPTSANQMPARLVWCESREAKDKLAALASEGNRAKVAAAPVVVIIGMDMAFYDELPWLFPHADARAWFVGNQPLIEASAFRNSTLQGAYFITAARALGLDTGPMSGFDNAAVDAAFFAGTTYRSNFISSLGYGTMEAVFPRSPRPEFAKFNTVI